MVSDQGITAEDGQPADLFLADQSAGVRDVDRDLLDAASSGPKTLWVATTNGEGNGDCRDCVALPNGETAITGEFWGQAQFAPHVIQGQGKTDVFVVKLDNNGKFVWARSFGGPEHDLGYSVAAGPGGAIGVTGIYRGEADFGGIKVKGGAQNRLFVARLTSAGKVSIVATPVSSTRSRGSEIAMDLAGNMYVCGEFSGLLQVDGTTLQAQMDDFFLARLSPAGDWDWAIAGTGSGDDFCGGLDIDAGGNIYACATSASPSFTVGTDTVGSIGAPTLVVLKLDPAGKLLWTKAVAPAVCSGLRVGKGGAALTGRFVGTAAFGSKQLQSAGAEDAFVAMVDPSGTTTTWSFAGGGPNADMAWGAATSPSSVYATGLFKLTASFGSTWLTSKGSNDMFLAKLSSSGTLDWIRSAGGDANESGQCVDVDENGDVVVGGGFLDGKMEIDGHSFHSSSPFGDVFVWKLTNTGP